MRINGLLRQTYLAVFFGEGSKIFKRPSQMRPSICLNSSRHLVSVSSLLEDGTEQRQMNLRKLSNQTVRYAAVKIENTVFISWSAFFLFWFAAMVVIHHSGAVLCQSNPEVVKRLLLLLRCSSVRMCYYQACSTQMKIKISVRWRHDITAALSGWGKGRVIATYSVIRRPECHYITWVTTKIKNKTLCFCWCFPRLDICLSIC